MGAGPIAQLLASLIAVPGVVSAILARPNTSMKIDHEIFSMVDLFLLLMLRFYLVSCKADCFQTQHTMAKLNGSVTLFILKNSSIWPQGYKTFFMLISTEHEIYHAHKC